jgi:hypothetical protein
VGKSDVCPGEGRSAPIAAIARATFLMDVAPGVVLLG